LSSAILYVAIVAIWAGVLIPRWLRRDTSASEQVIDETITPAETPVGRPAGRPAAEERPGPRLRADDAPRLRAESARPKDGRRLDAGRDDAPAEAGADGDQDALGDQEHARVLSARRRLLGLLLALTMGSAALAVTRTAAWWVIVPPSVMLLGYLALLREASKADAERRELALARAAEAAAQAEAPPVPVPVPAPDAEIIEFSAAQSITAAQDAAQDPEFYDQYADAKLRAVGDLARA
jgi:hypothetical protein